jgi:hypothetical protein
MSNRFSVDKADGDDAFKDRTMNSVIAKGEVKPAAIDRQTERSGEG